MLRMLILYIAFLRLCLSLDNFSGIKKFQISGLDGTCQNQVPIRALITGYRSEGSVFWANITTNISEDIHGKPRLYIKVLRCFSKENPDSCEEYFRAGPVNMCIAVNPKNPLGINYEPEIKCPIKKGLYKATDTKIDTRSLVMFRIDNWIWKVKAKVLEEKSDRLLFCITADFQAVRN